MAAAAVQRRYSGGIWPYLEYLDIYKSAWDINRKRPPGAEPFVTEGQVVNAGQTVCIVEAMKLMNEIGSDFNGVVRKVMIENAQPVEYGQPLFLVEIK